MHAGMMDLEYTGNADIDFVRGMIPHHIGAVDMCEGLLHNLTCTVVEDVDNLEGLVHFCNHVKLEQDIEVGGMRRWLENKNISEISTCDSEAMLMAKNNHNETGHMGNIGHDMGTAFDMQTQESCGNVTALSSEKLIEVNHKMHDLMAVKYTCSHSLDFVRMMLPHHAGAVDMCDILTETTQDSYLMELCSNITHTQRAEITWMSQWLEARDMAVRAPCDQNCSLEVVPFAPCEDTLSTSSFCHGIAGQSLDGYCRCDEATFNANGYSCGAPTWVEGFGLFVPEALCQRTCGKCSSSERPLWVPACGEGSQHHDMGSDSHGDNSHDDDDVLELFDSFESRSGAIQSRQLFVASAVVCMSTFIKLM